MEVSHSVVSVSNCGEVRVMITPDKTTSPAGREQVNMRGGVSRNIIISLLVIALTAGILGLILRHEVGIISESSLRGDLLKGTFHDVAGREYWMDARQRRSLNRRAPARRFWSIVDDEYKKAVAAGPPVMGRTLDNVIPAKKRNIHRLTDMSSAAILGLGTGVLPGITLSRKPSE